MEQTETRRQLESDVRRVLEHFLLAMISVCFILEFALAFYFYYTDDIDTSLERYIFKRVVLPCGLSIALYILMYIVNRYDKVSDDMKNRTCTTSLLMFCGEVSILHSYFIPLWMLPFFVLMFAGIFHDSAFHKLQAGMCFFFVLAAGFSHIIDYPEEKVKSIQYIVVAGVICIAISYFAFQLEKFSSRELLFNIMINENTKKYKAGYEFDALTGVYSRGRLEEEFNRVFDFEHGSGKVGVAMIDIDNFKSVNDTYGHDNGDIVLRKLGEFLGRFNTMESFCGRFGGEEFVVIFKKADSKTDLYELDNLRKLFEETKFSFTDDKVTISIGYHIGQSEEQWEDVLKKADEALYESKNTGKNKITVKE